MRLDHGYHGIYSLERQVLQDRIICAVLERGGLLVEPEGGGDDAAADTIGGLSEQGTGASTSDASPVEPWAIWTAGAMGAGKGHTLRILKQAAGIFPLQAYISVDPDEIKSVLPEMPAFLQRDRASASTLVHRESVMIADVCVGVAFLIRANVVIDGSLRDERWYSGLFRGYRETDPWYRLGIVHVHAEAEVVRRRAASRAETTGRAVPDDVLESAIRDVPTSVEALAPLVDMCVTIDNSSDDGPPRFVSETCEAFSRRWDAIRGAWVARLVEETAEGGAWGRHAAVSRRPSQVNSAAHAAARVLDGGSLPRACAIRHLVPRPPPLRSMPSMLQGAAAPLLASPEGQASALAAAVSSTRGFWSDESPAARGTKAGPDASSGAPGAKRPITGSRLGPPSVSHRASASLGSALTARLVERFGETAGGELCLAELLEGCERRPARSAVHERAESAAGGSAAAATPAGTGARMEGAHGRPEVAGSAGGMPDVDPRSRLVRWAMGEG